MQPIIMFGLQRFGVISFDSNNDNSIYQTAYSTVLFTTGLVHIFMYPSVSHKFDDWSKAFSMSLTAVTCSAGMIISLVSRMVAIYNVKYSYRKYKTTLEGFEIYVPTDAIASKHIKYVSSVLIVLCMIVIIPVNGLKLYNIFGNHTNPVLMTVYFGFYYIHNLSMVCVELHFVIQCLVVYTKFRDVNDKLVQTNDEQNCDYAARRLFGAAIGATSTTHRLRRSADDRDGGVESRLPCSMIVYEKDFYCPKDKRFPLANTVELLRIKHWLTREAVNDLKCLFGIRMMLSIIFIGFTSLFDVYTEVFYAYANRQFKKSVFRTKIMFIGWVLQYSLRFCIIVVPAHTVIQQVGKYLYTYELFPCNFGPKFINIQICQKPKQYLRYKHKNMYFIFFHCTIVLK